MLHINIKNKIPQELFLPGMFPHCLFQFLDHPTMTVNPKYFHQSFHFETKASQKNLQSETQIKSITKILALLQQNYLIHTS